LPKGGRYFSSCYWLHESKLPYSIDISSIGATEMICVISSKICLKCGSEDIVLDEDQFSCKNCGLSFCCFGGQK